MLKLEEKKLISQTFFGIWIGLGAVKSQNFSIFTGTTVDTAVENYMNFVNCIEASQNPLP